MLFEKMVMQPDDKDMRREIHKQNLNIAFFIGIITLVLGIFMYSGIASYQMVLYRKNIMGRLAFMRTPAYFILIAVSIGLIAYTLLTNGEEKKSSAGLDAFVIYFYTFVCALFGIFIAALEYQVGQHAYIFLLMMLLAFCVLALNPFVAMPMIIVSFLVFYELCKITVGVSQATLYRWAISTVIVCIISFIRWDDALSKFRTQRLLTVMSLYDPLTNCKNRNSFRQEFDDHIGGSVAIMVVDIDHFKEVNDKYGHGIGDAALREFGNLLRKVFDPENVYRFGGDEFIVAIKESTVDEFQVRCDVFLKKLKSLNVEGIDEGLSCSGGYVVSEIGSSEDMRFAVNQADEELYKAKAAGRKQIRGRDLGKEAS